MNILVVKLSSIGDIIFASPCLDALRRHWPEAHITVAVNHAFADLYAEHPAVDALRLRYMTRPTKRGRTLAEAAWSGLVHRYPRLDLAIDLQGTYGSAAWTNWSGARRKAGLGAGQQGWEFSMPIDHARHAVDQCAAVLEQLGVPVSDRQPRLHLSETDDALVVAYLKSRGLPERDFIAVHPFTAWRSKEWPAERYATVLRTLANKSDLRMIITGSKDEAERAGAISAMAESPRVVSVAGALSLGESLALWSRARLFLGGDTGALHASAAFGVQTVALFGPTSLATTGPVGTQNRIIQARVPERHGVYREPEGGSYMEEISEKQVLDVLSELLS
jgi:ADP-heptose:LPS heptosyltransferase